MTGIDTCEDGVYELVYVEGSRDYWSGEVDDYHYDLVPYIDVVKQNEDDSK